MRKARRNKRGKDNNKRKERKGRIRDNPMRKAKRETIKEERLYNRDNKRKEKKIT